MNSFLTALCLEICAKDFTSLPKSCWILFEEVQDELESPKMPSLKYIKKIKKNAKAATGLPYFRCIAFEDIAMVIQMSGSVGVLVAQLRSVVGRRS